ncbi:hypothetical protein HGM15179_005002, partial [Zosterops borbonicus]
MCLASAEGVKCKCSRKGPKIRFSNVRKLEIKPRYPFCVEEMIIVTLWTKVRGEQQHCLNPKRQNTVRLLKWYRVWKEKGRLEMKPPKYGLSTQQPAMTAPQLPIYLPKSLDICRVGPFELPAAKPRRAQNHLQCLRWRTCSLLLGTSTATSSQQSKAKIPGRNACGDGRDLSLLQPHQENQTSPELLSSFPGPAIPSQVPLLPSKNQFAKCYLSNSK